MAALARVSVGNPGQVWNQVRLNFAHLLNWLKLQSRHLAIIVFNFVYDSPNHLDGNKNSNKCIKSTVYSYMQLLHALTSDRTLDTERAIPCIFIWIARHTWDECSPGCQPVFDFKKIYNSLIWQDDKLSINLDICSICLPANEVKTDWVTHWAYI